MNNNKKEFDTPIKLPESISDFGTLVKGQYQFVDKTPFVKEIMEDGSEVILITRPRRFGKTMNLSMLYHFLQQQHKPDENLFKGLELSKDVEFCQKHQNQYPVIFISFRDVKQPTFDEAYTFIVELINELYDRHRYLLEDDILYPEEKAVFNSVLDRTATSTIITLAIKYLARYMKKKFNKPPIILIDEYDTPIEGAYLHGYYDKMIALMRGILGSALKDTSSSTEPSFTEGYLTKAVLTGITRVSQESLLSGLNNPGVYTMLRPEYGQYFGFTENEVIKLISNTKQSVSLDAIKEWYNGYQVGKYVLYNPWSIIVCLKSHGVLKPYWVNTSTNALIDKLLNKAEPVVKQRLEELLQGKIIEQPLSENLVFPDIEVMEEALWSLLFYAGYLKVLSSELRGSRLMAKLAIPNKEVSFVYDKVVEKWFKTALSLESYDHFVQSLANGDLERFKMYLSSYIMQTGSYFDFNQHTKEQIFQVFILGLVVGLRSYYYIYSNRESGLGRFDVALIPYDKQKKGVLLEFKTSETVEKLQDRAEEALGQIKDKEYVEEFKRHKIKTVLAIGMAFCGKNVELAHEKIEISGG